jgi:putative membrane protein
VAIFTVVVFLTSEAALCRAEWMNADVVRRLGLVDRIYWIAMAAVLATGLALLLFASKGTRWYAGNWLLHLKLLLLLATGAFTIASSRAFADWRRTLARGGALPDADQVRHARRQVMRAGHLLPLALLPAVFLARGFGG